jgi:hypothetical protein
MSANLKGKAQDSMPASGQQSEQLHLGIAAEKPDLRLLCRGIFSNTYLQQHFRQSEGFPTVEEVRPTYEAAKRRWAENLPGLRKQKEAYTRTAFLDPLLSELGWQFIPEAGLPKGLTQKCPDYCLFPSAEARQEAASKTTAVDVFRHADTALEAKKWQHPLDEVSKLDKRTLGLFPSQQVQNYLRQAKDSTGERFFDWAILTNGNLWRLYCEHAANDAYFEFTLANDDAFCLLEEFRLFVALFRPAVFARGPGKRCPLDGIREESLNRQAALESNLRKRIFDVLEDLANGFREWPANGIKPAEYAALYDNSLIFLYRLLFVLYAESRDLLPVKPHGYGANKTYREKFSLAGIVASLRDKTNFTDDAFTDLYERLLKLFHLINGDNPKQNEATKVTRYNGGLFNGTLHPLLDQWRVGDRTLANVLRQLIFAQPPARASAKQQQITTDEAIDYAALEVRQLGDIYEGLLGAQLAESTATKRLELRNRNGENHRHGIFYTPDWVVRYLLQETTQPLLDEIEARPAVQTARLSKSDEKRRDNSFALAVLRLNLVDPAMGSGHFLVRATEWLAEQIVYHPTTRIMTEQIVHSGSNRRTKDEILAAGRVPVPPGVSQEQAEIAYWRRRVVEACIYGVDVNPLAVELAKLSLWLTCIAVDEPLSFLDHHLRHGNSLLSAAPEVLSHGPFVTDEERRQITDVDIGNRLPAALQTVIAENVDIEQTASTEMELVKAKEKRWKSVRDQFRPFLNCADLWLAALDGLPLSEHDYRLLVLSEIAPHELDNAEKATAKKLRNSLAADLAAKQAALTPFHWYLEFPDVFYEPDGTLRPADECGFDAILGNPPYISTHTSSTAGWRAALEKQAGYLEDLYVHFTDLGFQLLRPGGGFGFIVSDTFFTLASKLRMRAMLQRHTLTHLGQCDPFDATVDAAIFVARKNASAANDCLPPASGGSNEAKSADTHQSAEAPHLIFIQARPRKDNAGKATTPDKDLPLLKPFSALPGGTQTDLAGGHGIVAHRSFGGLRIHRVPAALYHTAHKRVFFEPRPGTLRLFEKFNQPVKDLVATWWERIETSQKVTDNAQAIRAYQDSLRPDDITLVGLVAEGGQGMRTANNARFLGYLEGTPQAQDILGRREKWTQRWLADAAIKPVFLAELTKHGGDPAKPTRNSAAWEASVEPLRSQFTPAQLGFSKSDLYRIVPANLVANDSDFRFAFEQRKAELVSRWKTEPKLSGFWQSELKDNERRRQARSLKAAKAVTDAEFCALCQELQVWLVEENALRKRQRRPTISREALGLRSSEDYSDPADAPRVATIYNGLSGHGQFVAFRKGDPEGNRWVDNEPLFINWSQGSVLWFFANSGRPESGMPVMRNPHLYFTGGVTWTAVANHVAMKARYQEPCVFDADSMRLTPRAAVFPPLAFLALLNSDVVSFIKMKFIKHTQKWEIGDLRQIPLVIPTKAHAERLTGLATQAMEAKRLTFTGGAVPHALVASVRDLTRQLLDSAPAYLRPSAQAILLTTAADCLQILELAVNWEAERLYGVEGLGPFDEF